jgi:DNA polymerase-3 subunit gamma/tau
MAGDVPSPALVDPAGPGAPAVRLALYRRYRPATFAELKGQEHVTEPLRQALRSGRVNHAYLFSGPRGCGKTSSARILARSLNCEQGPTPDPCGKCASCVALAPSGPGSIDVIEIDAASHGGVDDARDLRERAFYAPVAARFKIYIIDEAHMVTGGGFNALLKLVEEPPPHLKFVFATTEPEKVIPTIRSRTHHYPFRLLAPGVLRELLEEILASEDVKYEPSVLPVVIRAGAGSARDSLSILDQLLAGSGEEGLTYERAIALLGFTDENLLDEVTEAFSGGDGAAVFRAVDRVVESGHDPRRFALDLLDRLRDLIVLAAVPDAGTTGLLDLPADRLGLMRAQTEKFGQAQLARAAEVVSAGLVEMRGATSPRLLLELMCAQVLLPGAAVGELAMLARLESLERRLAYGAGAGAAGHDAPAAAIPATAASPQAVASPRATASPRAAETGPDGRSAPAGSSTSQSDSGPRPERTAARPPGRPRDESPPPAGTAPQPDGGSRADSSPRADREPQADSGPPAASAQPVRDSGPGHAPSRPASPGRADTDTVRERWPEILEAVKHERRVAWILLDNATVDSLSDGVLTLNFSNEGYAKGFSASSYDQDLGRVLQAIIGTAPQIRSVSGGPAGRTAAGRPDRAGPSQPAPASGPASATRQAMTDQPPAGRPAAGRAARDRRQDPPAGPGDDLADDPGPYDAEAPGPVGGGESLTGMDLIERELGGKVIEEPGDG